MHGKCRKHLVLELTAPQSYREVKTLRFFLIQRFGLWTWLSSGILRCTVSCNTLKVLRSVVTFMGFFSWLPYVLMDSYCFNVSLSVPSPSLHQYGNGFLHKTEKPLGLQVNQQSYSNWNYLIMGSRQKKNWILVKKHCEKVSVWLSKYPEILCSMVLDQFLEESLKIILF